MNRRRCCNLYTLCLMITPCLATVGIAGCDRGANPGDQKDPSTLEKPGLKANQDLAKTPPTPKPGPAADPSKAAPQPIAKVEPAKPSDHPEPEAAPKVPRTEFEALVVGIDKSDTTIPDDANKAAWAHYKAGRYNEAMRLFVLTASKDPAWKHAHNAACAAAKAGHADKARIALAESFRRGGETAMAKARKDSDLSTVRGEAWFSALLRGKPTEPAQPTVEHPKDDSPKPNPTQSNLPSPANSIDACPPGASDEHECHAPLPRGDFVFGPPIAFETPITLELDLPASMPKRRWSRVKKRLPWRALKEELGLRNMYGINESNAGAHQHPGWSTDHEWDDFILKPAFWWPTEGQPILVIPHTQRIRGQDGTGAATVHTLTMARKTADGWKASTLRLVPDNHIGWGGSAILETMLELRWDSEEWITLSQIYDEADEQVMEGRYACRIRWYEGALRQACTTQWAVTEG